MGGPSGDFESKFQAYLCDDIRLLALVFCLLVFVFFLEVKVVAERSPIQTAAILICLTGERGDNLPP